jgi:rSAM/selenodomain-associated transferase 2/rSAM/selenodomain-associated transferase 1
MRFHRKQHNDRIIIFGRYPRPGKVKTRLIPTLGSAGAAELQRRLTEKTFKTALEAASDRNIDVEFRVEGGREDEMRRWLGINIVFSEQEAGGLGERMHHAFKKAFKEGCRRVVLVGTDIPGLKPDHLREAFTALKDRDLVLGPSTDGGYWVIGLKKAYDLFQGVEWGTGKVLNQTLALANWMGLTSDLLGPLRDLDTVEDLRQWGPETVKPGPYMSVIIPTLNEANYIEETIERALDEDVEIIVVDGGSRDDTIRKATDLGVRVEASPPGRAKQQNHGAAVTRGGVLLFLHADTWLPKGYVSRVFETLLDSKTAVGAFRFKTDTDHWMMKAVDLMTNLRARTLKMPYGDQALFMRKAMFESVGGFPDVPIVEDLFLVRRLAKEGCVRIVTAPVITSARRWQTLGVVRTSLINVVIATAVTLGFSPRRFVSLYRNDKTHRQS